MKRIAVLAAVAVVAVAAGGCGSSKKKSASTTSSSTTSAPASTSSAAPTTGASALKLSADPSGAFKFNTTSLSAKAGKITITMSNPSAITHAIAVKGAGINKKGSTVGQGSTSTVTVALKPGTYQFYCPVDGHAAAGMTGTLTVK